MGDGGVVRNRPQDARKIGAPREGMMSREVTPTERIQKSIRDIDGAMSAKNSQDARRREISLEISQLREAVVVHERAIAEITKERNQETGGWFARFLPKTRRLKDHYEALLTKHRVELGLANLKIHSLQEEFLTGKIDTPSQKKLSYERRASQGTATPTQKTDIVREHVEALSRKLHEQQSGGRELVFYTQRFDELRQERAGLEKRKALTSSWFSPFKYREIELALRDVDVRLAQARQHIELLSRQEASTVPVQEIEEETRENLKGLHDAPDRASSSRVGDFKRRDTARMLLAELRKIDASLEGGGLSSKQTFFALVKQRDLREALDKLRDNT